MTREEIVSALRYCRNAATGCVGCPLDGARDDYCMDTLMCGAADLIENQAREIEALAQANAAKTERLEKLRWISVEEALPQPFVSVLGYMPEEAPLPTVHECYYADVRGGEWYSMWCYGTKKVTHWMPMPEKEGKDG